MQSSRVFSSDARYKDQFVMIVRAREDEERVGVMIEAE
jgi:hypothetical protein